jgi:hypothetical protein
MLNSIANRLSKSVWLRHLFFLSAALLAINLVGYFFGTFDQAFHIPFLKKFADSALYPGDSFLDLRFFHYSFFWFLFEPFYKINMLEPAMFVVHFLATYAAFWMLWELSNTLFKNPLSNLIATLAFIFPHVGLSGFQVIEYSLLNRSFVLPFLIGAITLYLRRRYFLTFLILGIVYNLHVLSVNYVMAMILFDAVVRIRQIGLKNIVAGLAIFIIFALPVLIWRAGNGSLDLSLQPILFAAVVTHGPLSTVYEWISTLPQAWICSLAGLATLAFFLIARKNKDINPLDRTVTNFVIAIGIVVLVETITTYWLPVTILVQQQLLRIGVYLLIIGYLYFSNYLASKCQSIEKNHIDLAILLTAFVTFISPLMAMGIWILRRWYEGKKVRRIVVTGIWVTIQVTMMAIALPLDLWAPGIHIYPPQTTWVATQEWAKENTPITARFITPPQIYWFYTPDWRAISERATLIEYPELMDVFFDPSYYVGFKQRFEAIAPGALEKFDGSHIDNIRVTRDAFYSLSAQDFIRVAQTYQITYLVVEKPHTYPFVVAYENKDYIVYDLSSSMGRH